MNKTCVVPLVSLLFVFVISGCGPTTTISNVEPRQGVRSGAVASEDGATIIQCGQTKEEVVRTLGAPDAIFGKGLNWTSKRLACYLDENDRVKAVAFDQDHNGTSAVRFVVGPKRLGLGNSLDEFKASYGDGVGEKDEEVATAEIVKYSQHGLAVSFLNGKAIRIEVREPAPNK